MTRVMEIPTKEFANRIAVNLTDVRVLSILTFAVFDAAIRTTLMNRNITILNLMASPIMAPYVFCDIRITLRALSDG